MWPSPSPTSPGVPKIVTEEVLLEPFAYLCKNPGKEIRTAMITAFDQWLQVPKDQLIIITKIIEMLHNASLLVDDVEDDSQLRRGKPVAHKIFGIAATVNCANYVYFLALNEMQKLTHYKKAVDVFTEELMNLHRGQGMEIYWRDNSICPSVEEYLEMINNSKAVLINSFNSFHLLLVNKETGGLLRLALRLMQLHSEYKNDLTPLGNILGVHFQVRDDLVNLISSKYAKGKGFCEDFTEGKYSFPIIHCILFGNHEQSRNIRNILRQKTTNNDLKEYAVTLLNESGAIQEAKNYLLKVEQEARDFIKESGGNPELEKILDKLCVDYI